MAKKDEPTVEVKTPAKKDELPTPPIQVLITERLLEKPEVLSQEHDKFAMAALAGYGRVTDPEVAADYCYEVAKAMIARHGREPDDDFGN